MALITDIVGDPAHYKSTDSTTVRNAADDADVLAISDTDNGVETKTFAAGTLVWSVQDGQMYKSNKADMKINSDGTPSDAFDATYDDDGDADTDEVPCWTKVYKGYPDFMLDTLAKGKPLIGLNPNLVHPVTGGSLIPDGAMDNFSMSSKASTVFSTIRTTDAGAAFVSASTSTNSVNNENVYTDEAANSCLFVPYTASNKVAQINDPLQVTKVGNYTTITNSHSVNKGNNLTQLIGKVGTGDGVDLESKVVEDVVYDSAGAVITSPKHTAIQVDGTSPATKVLHAVAKDNEGMLHYQVVLQEMKHDDTDYGDTGKFDNLTNGTATDLNSATVRTVVASKPLNQYTRSN